MRVAIYLDKRENTNILAMVDLEVVPRGIYEINGVKYLLNDQPKFVIGGKNPFNELIRVELVVSKI